MDGNILHTYKTSKKSIKKRQIKTNKSKTTTPIYNKYTKHRKTKPPARTCIRDTKPWSVYCIISSVCGKSYIGASVDIHKRLRQHNGEIKGGARATHYGRPRTRVCHVQGFPNERTALQFEWKWKSLSSTGSKRKKVYVKKSENPFSKVNVKHAALKKRLVGLWMLSMCEKYTYNAPLSKTIPVKIVWEDETRTECMKILRDNFPSHFSVVCCLGEPEISSS